MTSVLRLTAIAVSCAATVLAADLATPPVNKIFAAQFTGLERGLVSLAEAMPAEKYSFAPTQGEFAGVRTFGQQVSHTAAVIYAAASAVLEEKNPTEMGARENGPASLKTKDEIVRYLKDAIAYGHKAMGILTDQNLTQPVPSPFGSGKISRLSMANAAIWHSYDHYGQMVVYVRMNGIVPPASRQQ
jgi:hypothetical protein